MSGRGRLRVLHTPATLAVGGPPLAEHEEIARESAGGRPLGSGTLASLRRGGWLGGEEWGRGGYLTTSGLRQAVGHPELALLNVPGAMAPWAQELLGEIGGAILEGGARIKSGEILILTDPRYAEMAVTFELLEPEALPAPSFAREMLLVIPLP